MYQYTTENVTVAVDVSAAAAVGNEIVTQLMSPAAGAAATAFYLQMRIDDPIFLVLNLQGN